MSDNHNYSLWLHANLGRKPAADVLPITPPAIALRRSSRHVQFTDPVSDSEPSTSVAPQLVAVAPALPVVSTPPSSQPGADSPVLPNPLRTGHIPLSKPRNAERFDEAEARRYLASKRTHEVVPPDARVRAVPAHSVPARVPLTPAQRSFAHVLSPRARLANKLASFRPSEALSVEELMLFNEVLPPKVAAAKVSSPQLCTKKEETITDMYRQHFFCT